MLCGGLLEQPTTNCGVGEQMNLFLIGYRGTGKTTVAEHLAQGLCCQWVDADVEIERLAGCSIAKIFARDGETTFRDLETQVVLDLTARNDTVVALGGGAVMREQNRQAIADQGTIIWLKATAETIHQRISADDTTAGRRPNLTTTGGLAEIERLLSERHCTYQACANMEIDTDNKTPRAISREILVLLGPTA